MLNHTPCKLASEIGLHQKYVIIDCSTIDTAGTTKNVLNTFSSWGGRIWAPDYSNTHSSRGKTLVITRETFFGTAQSVVWFVYNGYRCWMWVDKEHPMPCCHGNTRWQCGCVQCIHSHTVTTTWVPCCLVDVVELCHWIVEHLSKREMNCMNWVMETILSQFMR